MDRGRERGREGSREGGREEEGRKADLIDPSQGSALLVSETPPVLNSEPPGVTV